MLGLLLRLLLPVVAIGAVTAIVLYISGTITRSKLKDRLMENEMGDAIIEAVDRCRNIVTISDMESGNTLEIHGDDVSYEITEGDWIYI